jgi:hypothetical protein
MEFQASPSFRQSGIREARPHAFAIDVGYAIENSRKIRFISLTESSAAHVESLLSGTNTHASRWTVLLNLKRVVEAKEKDLLCSMR